MSQKGLRVEFTLPRPRKRYEEKPAPKDSAPRIARMLALGHHWERSVRTGEVASYAELARLSGLTTARVSQICSLTLLAPCIQETLLTMPEERPERTLRPLSAEPAWHEQDDNPRYRPR